MTENETALFREKLDALVDDFLDETIETAAEMAVALENNLAKLSDLPFATRLAAMTDRYMHAGATTPEGLNANRDEMIAALEEQAITLRAQKDPPPEYDNPDGPQAA